MSTSDDMRKFIGYMNGKKPEKPQVLVAEKKNDISIRDMLGIMRTLNEDVNLSTDVDDKNEEEKMSEYFGDNNVTIDFFELKVYPNGVIFGGTFDGQFDFIYKVTPDENTSGIEINYLDDFESQDPENDEIIKKVESYYDIFYKYWRDQLFN